MWNPLQPLTDRLVPSGWVSTTGLVERILRESEALREVSDEDLRLKGVELKWTARSGSDLLQLLPSAFSLMREACRRSLGKAHYPVQLAGAIAIARGGLAEMQTGEGKTLTAVLPAYLRALVGRCVHVITVNDYLAERDANENRPAFDLLSMTVGCILTPQS
ncbi:MAG: translocase, partial [Planctomycetaceae bacterium]